MLDFSPLYLSVDAVLIIVFLIPFTYQYLVLAQKEHYIAGTCSKFALRWLKFPRYRAPLFAKNYRPKFTRRFNTFAVVAIALISALTTLSMIFLLPVFPILAITIFVPIIIDAVLAILKPIEESLSKKYVKTASARLRKVSPMVVGITGSYGKTSTKNHLKELLSDIRQTVATPASWNNRAGLSRAINENLSEGTEVFIAEMGMYKMGEIRELCSWVKPSISIITCIGKSHLERIGSQENILKAKSEILENASTAVLWVSDERLDELSKTLSGKRVIRCGYRGKAQLEVEVFKDEDDIYFYNSKGEEIGRISATSELHESNIACALGAIIAMDIDVKSLGKKLSTLSTPQHRATLGRADKGYLVIDNTFNSNLIGAKSNIEKLKSEIKDGKKYIVTPGLVELGKDQYESNYELGKFAVENDIELIITHFTNRKAIGDGAKAARAKPIFFKNRELAVEWIRKNLNEKDGVLYENDLPVYYP